MAVSDSDLDYEKVYDETLIAAAKAANGYVYYETKLTRKKRGDDSEQIRVDVYEKYRKQDSKAVALLKQLGVELVIHKRS